jgi:hypothetical protein
MDQNIYMNVLKRGWCLRSVLQPSVHGMAVSDLILALGSITVQLNLSPRESSITQNALFVDRPHALRPVKAETPLFNDDRSDAKRPWKRCHVVGEPRANQSSMLARDEALS